MPYVRKTSAEYFAEIKRSEDFWIAHGNFLDDFYSGDATERIRLISQPVQPDSVTPESRQFAAYFAGMVGYLCLAYRIESPTWVEEEVFFLSEPWFIVESWRFRAWQLVTTPPHFSRHNVWTGDDPVSRDGRGPTWTEHQWDWEAFDRGENDVVLTVARGRARQLGVAFWYKDNGQWVKENPNGVVERWRREYGDSA